jgi:hypothetical protein
MPIQNHEDAFAAICSILNIERIYDIMIISDDQIRSMCTASNTGSRVTNDDCSTELAEILIKIKKDTIDMASTELASVMRDTV